VNERDEYRRAVFVSRCWMAAAILSVFGCLFVGFALARHSSYLQTILPTVDPVNLRIGILGGSIIAAGVTALVCLSLAISNSGVHCCYCRHPRLNEALAIATEHCETCGRHLPFYRPLHGKYETIPTPATTDDRNRPAASAFIGDVVAYFRYLQRVILWPTTGIGTGCVLLLLALILTSAEQQALRSTIALLLVLVGLLPTLYLIIAWACWRRPALLTCPHCNRFLVALRSIVIASRHCPHCGCRLLREPVVGE